MRNLAVKLGALVCVLFVFGVFGCATLPHPDEMKADIATYQLPKQPDAG